MQKPNLPPQKKEQSMDKEVMGVWTLIFGENLSVILPLSIYNIYISHPLNEESILSPCHYSSPSKLQLRTFQIDIG